MTEPKRRAWLEKLLGKEKAEAVRADTQAATAQLDQIGVERKQMKPMMNDDEHQHEEGMPMPEGEEKPATEHPETEPEEDKQGDMMQQVGDKLAQTLFDAAQGNLAQLTQEQVASVIAEALRPVVEDEAPVEQPPPAPPEDEQMTQDTSKSKAPAPAAEGVKALTELLSQMTKDQGEMAKTYAAQTEVLTRLAETVKAVDAKAEEAKALKPVVEALVKQVEAMAARLGDAPRTSTLAPETTLEGLGSLTPEQAKAIAGALNKSNNERRTKLGIPVKSE